MGIYAKVVSVQKEIKEIKAKVGENTKQIVHVWATVDGIQRMLWPDNVVNLVGATKYEADIVWPAGRYSVDVQSGAPYVASSYGNPTIGLPARIQQTVDIPQDFIVRAYCGSRGTSASGGVNPYSGAFKVNAVTSNSAVPAVSHIFGNAGSFAAISGASGVLPHRYGSGNCLGNGAAYNGSAIGAGSCLHFIPVGGTFGTDYLAAFHCAAPTYTNSRDGGGCGSAYGGAGSGTAYSSGGISSLAQSYNGGSTPYGSGGAGHSTTSGLILGSNGTGPGYGYGGGVSADGAGAWFDGTEWHDSRATGGAGEDGHIIVKYVGPIE